LVADVRDFAAMAHERPAGEVLYRFLRQSGLLARLVATDAPGAEEALQNIARFFEIIRAQSALLADDRAIFVSRHLATLIEAGDDPATADLDADIDAVAVLTVHKAKGLEFPVVYVPGLVAGRFPLSGRGDALTMPEGLGRGQAVTPDHAIAEERRLCYVAFTRARDELILSHAADYGGARARRVSPFVLEALDLPSAAGVPGAGARTATPMERLAGFEASAPVVTVPTGPITEPLALSFYQIDDYLTCPRKYKYAHVLRVPLAPHHAIVYGAALHKAVQQFHVRHARGDVMTDEELVAAFEAAWSNEGFVSRDHEEARLEAGRAALRRFRAAQLEPDAVVPAYVEREFSFALGGDRIRGRWDRVDIEPIAGPLRAAVAEATAPAADVVSPTLGMLGPERVTITDYKSSDVRDPAKARQRARESLQLQIYAMGYEAMTGRLPDAVALHFLESGLVGTVDVDPKRLARARARIERAAAGIRARDYTATPEFLACTYCAFREICPSSVAGRTTG
jgi:DNA helicase-2/ATP-dependent DNA helicase PcrA